MERREPAADPASCTVQAQMISLDYIKSHPQWRLKGWRCEKDMPSREPA
jgi:hypothetical protein